MCNLKMILTTLSHLFFASLAARHISQECSTEQSAVTCGERQTKINGVCRDGSCDRGYYLKNGFCHRCHYTCKTCLSFGVCDSCAGGRILHSGSCLWKCPKKHRSINLHNSAARVCAHKKDQDVRCLVGEWTEWGECGNVGGPHVKQRTREVGGGPACSGIAPIQHRHCFNVAPDPTATKCPVSEWLPWESCDDSCLNQFRRRRRIALPDELNDGLRRKRTTCPNLVEQQPCPCFFQQNTHTDTEQCKLGEWSGWAACDAPCGSGSQTRTKSPVNPETMGRICRSFSETKPCCKQTCRDYCSNTLLGSWSGWGRCEGLCENSFRRRVRTNLFPALLMFCDMELIHQEKPCKKKGCRGKCEMSDWGAWTGCDTNGTRYRYREKMGGSNCPELVDSMPCNG